MNICMDKTNTDLSYVKLVLGPSLVFSEMILGGFFIENLKITKQATNENYNTIIKNCYKKNGIGMFYRGFYPWGALQCIKGMPILFTQHHTSYYLKKKNFLKNEHREIIGGVLGGISQSIFMTPLQRLRTIVLTNDSIKGLNTSSLLRQKIHEEGISTIYRGLLPTMIRRGSEWGVRFGGYNYAQQYFKNKKSNKKLTFNQNILSGVFGGICGSILVPLDVMVSKYQKDGIQHNGIKLVKDLYSAKGIPGFFQGFTLKALEGSYHTIWMIGIGNIVFNYFKNK